MKILILTTSNPYKTAGVVALDLFKGLSSINGNEVKVLVKYWGKYPDKNIIPFESCFTYCKNWVFNKFRNLLTRFKIIKPILKKTNPDYCMQDYNQTITYYSTNEILKKVNSKPDAIIVLFMQNYLSFKNLYELNRLTQAPIYLYLMDMAPMTGGCHYAWDCIGYTKDCGTCPAIYSSNQNDQTRVNYMFKKMYIDMTNIFPIAGTEWQFNQLVKSSLYKNKRNFKILCPINGDQYYPSDKIKTRQELGLPYDKKIILFGAISVANRRKGFDKLFETLKIFSKEIDDPTIIHLAIAGENDSNCIENLPFSFTLFGYLVNNDLSKVFQAADVFVCPSIEDSGPMMINQSIMSGTPVVAFEMGVALDLVHTGQTGYRAKLGDTVDMANGLKEILLSSKEEYSTMVKNCRNLGIEMTSIKNFSDSFISIILNRNTISNLE